MAKAKGKDAEIELDATDISAYVSNIGYEESADEEDVTTLGNDSHVRGATLEDGTISLEGWYETGATGPREVVKPLIGTVVAFAYRPEGTGAGLPEETGNVLVQNYTETAPVAGHITWAANLLRSGDWTTAAQV
jgi:hypothetical protein